MTDGRVDRIGQPDKAVCPVVGAEGHRWEIVDSFSSGMYEAHAFVCSECGARTTKGSDLRPEQPRRLRVDIRRYIGSGGAT
jgi:hypothetical protein